MFYRAHNANQTGISGIGLDIFNNLYFKGLSTGKERFPLEPVLHLVEIIDNRSNIEDFSAEGAALSLLIDDDPNAVWGGVAFAKQDFYVDLNIYLLGEDENGKSELVLIKITVKDRKLLKALSPYFK